MQAKFSTTEPELEVGLAKRLNEEKVIILDNEIIANNNGKIIVPKAIREEVMKRFHSHHL